MRLCPTRVRCAVAVAILAGAAALGTAACSAPGSSAGRDTGQASPAAPARMDPGMAMGPATGTASPARVTIHISGSAYSDPGPVAAGATVTVMNMDSRPHTVTADDGSFNTVAQPGQSVAFTAPTTPGTYPYHCQYHTDMHAALTVR